MSAIRIVIVDDHAIVRQGLAKIIGLYDDLQLVGEAADGEEAIGVVKKCAPDVVLMDVRMRGMDGVEATRQICAQMPQTDVIVLSNYDEDHYIFEALQAGAKGYLLKDVAADRLASAVRAVAAGGSSLDGSLMDRVVTEFRHLRTGSGPGPGLGRLTPREQEVLQRLVEGRNNQEIALELVVSEKTVKSHLTSIYRKLNVRDRSQAIVTALGFGLAAPPSGSR